MTRRPASYGLWVTALCCSLPLWAAADGRLRWQAPRGCPTQQELERALASVEGAAGLSVDGAVARDHGGYRLRLRVEGEGQSFERELSAGSCEVLLESAVFLVELAGSQLRAAGPTAAGADAQGSAGAERGGGVGKEAAARSTTDARAADRPEAATELLSTALPETTHRAPADARSAAESGEDALAQTWSLRLGFGAAMIDAGLSGVTPHLALDLSLAISEWSIGLRVGALLHPALRIADGAEVDLQTNAAQVLGCRYWDVAGVLIGPCMALSALRTSAESIGLSGQQRGSATWLTAGPALQLQLRVTRSLFLGLELGAWAALTPRPSFEVSGATLTRAGTLAGYARLGAAYELW